MKESGDNARPDLMRRRDFVRGLIRGALGAGLGTVAAVLAARGGPDKRREAGAVCPSLCEGCPLINGCSLADPAASGGGRRDGREQGRSRDRIEAGAE